jgi:hypothetical protein
MTAPSFVKVATLLSWAFNPKAEQDKLLKLVPTVLYDTVSLGLRRLQLAPVLAHLCRGRFRWRHLGTEGVVAEPFRASPVTVYIL